MKCQIQFFWQKKKNKKNISICRLLKNLSLVLSVNTLCQNGASYQGSYFLSFVLFCISKESPFQNMFRYMYLLISNWTENNDSEPRFKDYVTYKVP